MRAHLVTVTGVLNRSSGHSLGEELDRLSSSSDAIIDLDAATFVDPVVLDVLLVTSRRLRRSGASLIVVCDRDRILRRFGCSHAVDLHVEPSSDEAFRYVIGRVLLQRLQRSAALRARM